MLLPRHLLSPCAHFSSASASCPPESITVTALGIADHFPPANGVQTGSFLAENSWNIDDYPNAVSDLEVFATHEFSFVASATGDLSVSATLSDACNYPLSECFAFVGINGTLWWDIIDVTSGTTTYGINKGSSYTVSVGIQAHPYTSPPEYYDGTWTGSFSWSFPVEPVEPEIIPKAFKWNAVSGVDFTYEVTESYSQDAKVAVYWAAGPNFEDQISLLYEEAAEGTPGTYGPVNVPGSSLINPPPNATHLIFVADPDLFVNEALKTLPLTVAFTLDLTTFIPGNYVPGPPRESCIGPNGSLYMVYSGDDRHFDPQVESYRTRQRISLIPSESVDSDGLSGTAFQATGRTFQFAKDALSDKVINGNDMDGIANDCHLWNATDQATSDGMLIEVERVGPLTVRARLYTGLFDGPNNPFVWYSPSIDWDFEVTIDISTPKPAWTLEGTWDGFPAVEVYINDQPLYHLSPGPGPYSLADLAALLPGVGDETVNLSGFLDDPSPIPSPGNGRSPSLGYERSALVPFELQGRPLASKAWDYFVSDAVARARSVGDLEDTGPIKEVTLSVGVRDGESTALIVAPADATASAPPGQVDKTRLPSPRRREPHTSPTHSNLQLDNVSAGYEWLLNLRI